MSSLVLELQRDALNKDVDVSDLLRKAYAVAVKLKLDKFEAWVDSELNGYASRTDLPDYRMFPGRVRAFNPYNGIWLTVRFADPAAAETYSRRYERGPIGPIQDMVARASNGTNYSVGLPQAVQHHLLEDDDAFNEIRLEIGLSSLVRILDAVRNRILQWSLTLEQEGILGEGMTFSAKEQQTAATHSDQLQASVINIGTMVNSSIQQGSDGARLTDG